MNELIQTDKMQELIEHCKKLPAAHMPLTHQFASGVYLRTIFMPKGTFVIGAKHKTEHFNIVTTGIAKVNMNGEVHEIKAPAMFVSGAGVRKTLAIIEDMTWTTIHPLAGLEHCGQDIKALEDALAEDAHDLQDRRIVVGDKEPLECIAGGAP